MVEGFIYFLLNGVCSGGCDVFAVGNLTTRRVNDTPRSDLDNHDLNQVPI